MTLLDTIPARAADMAPPPAGARRRRCIVTRQDRPVGELLRFVADPDGNVVPDITGRLPGRGLWLLPHRDIVLQACRRNMFARAARRQVHRPADQGQALVATVEALLARRCVEVLGLARRAGQATMGYEKVHAWLRGLPPAVPGAALLQARDGAAGSCSRLAALAAAIAAPVARVDVLTAAELGQAFARDRVVHVGLAPVGNGPKGRGGSDRLVKLLVAEAGRLAGFRAVAGNAGDASDRDAVKGAGGGDG